ncbi:MAG TPA: DUF1800 domain-containing protein [Haliscomenobacter sp.]|uniref:DUF1800 domain-containing protein n=1 Tax=Haliscomenobacter sp. TaxID=2717303 RepID=UPI002C208A7A|nr:DUF1800 domain-containing protein [Haliscomenobacter sp.]HOY19157.1 DUF1800 domain-containing protein [Haliscomenobacter sp.]
MEKIKHLYWRAGFGLSPTEWQQKREWPISKAIDELFTQARQAQVALPMAEMGLPEDMEKKRENRELFEQVLREEKRRIFEYNVNWVYRMANPKESALLERMTFFWHGHFACKPDFGKLSMQYLNTLRKHALGNFKDMLLAVAQDPAMIRYLNNQQNRKEKPNENFARELMELFTLGRGKYSEKDIKEAARAFTGWSSDLRGDYLFRPFWHDYGSKTFFGKTGNFDGADIINIILERPETAQFIVRKVYKHFVNEQVDEAVVSTLSKQFYQSGYDIGKLMRSIFSSEWFYAPQNMGNRIKSPIEFTAGLMRTVDMKFDQPMGMLFIQRALGQILFNPPNVAGWPGGKTWIDNSTLMLRLNLPGYLFNATEFSLRTKGEFEDEMREKGGRRLSNTLNMGPLSGSIKGSSANDIAAELSKYLLSTQPALPIESYTKELAATDRESIIRQMTLRLMTLPEYQLC